MSSGGYGAMTMGMQHPDIFSVIANHSGDGLFDMCFKNIFHEVCNATFNISVLTINIKANNVFRHNGGVSNWYNNVYLSGISTDNLQSHTPFVPSQTRSISVHNKVLPNSLSLS